MIKSILAYTTNIAFLALFFYCLVMGGFLSLWADKSGIGIQLNGIGGLYQEFDTTEYNLNKGIFNYGKHTKRDFYRISRPKPN
jgi:hypothetical protein